ncbi:MAG TPA: nucleotidyltransferase family protein [Acidobacteriota bacterium]|nr:nucleotidyltransferase family protein [Acidobacteriota bacterium]
MGEEGVRELGPELELLLLAARQQLNEAQASQLADVVRHGVDWDSVLRRGRTLGVHGFLQRHLARIDSNVPGWVREELEKQHRFRAIANLKNWNQLREIGQAFNRAGIPVGVLKGAYLAFWVYEDPALRPMSDLDLLCRQEDWDAVSKVLGELGYRQDAQNPLSFAMHPPPFKRARSTTVEMHTSLRGRWTGDELLGRSRIVEREGVCFHALGFQDLVCYLVAHIAQHSHTPRPPLYWFADLHEVIGGAPDCGDPSSLFEKDAAQARVWSFLKAYWLDSPRLVPGARVLPPHQEIAGRIAGWEVSRPRHLQAVRNMWRIRGLRLKLAYLKSLAFPSAEHMIRAGQMKPGENVCWCHVRRLLSISRQVIGLR